ncbi:MAG TPA: hypothetical protein VNN09_01595 [Candidatus Competibacteraceae bacterium]|nr:hypothetical protein [Candidatus Competibacteraceae bacterium]
MLTRLAHIKPFVLHETMVPAAALSPIAQTTIERYLAEGRRELRARVHTFLRWLQSADGRQATPAAAQRRFSFLRLRFNAVLAQFDLFADVLTQRSEHETGVWLSGLDVVAADALALPGYYQAPPVICYLDRGVGAAIRRARTRLPGGGENPVAIIRVPRERMVGSGIASSLVHEVGHQAAALLDLVNSLRQVLQRQESGETDSVWRFWERWLSEILADFWSVARVGIAATMGLIGVVSLPRAFVFRLNLDDPHPLPWIRVKLSCAMGDALYPHPQWQRLARLWESFYPPAGLDEQRRELLARLEAGMADFVELLLEHRPQTLRGKSLREVMEVEKRQPERLAAYYQAWQRSPVAMRAAPPALAFAVIGQARADGRMSPEEESNVLARLLTHWALRSTLDTSALCAELPSVRVGAPAT